MAPSSVSTPVRQHGDESEPADLELESARSICRADTTGAPSALLACWDNADEVDDSEFRGKRHEEA
jgi:hypothetical protein